MKEVNLSGSWAPSGNLDEADDLGRLWAASGKSR